MSKKDIAFLYGTNSRLEIKGVLVRVLHIEVVINMIFKRWYYSLLLTLVLYRGTAVLLRNAP